MITHLFRWLRAFALATGYYPMRLRRDLLPPDVQTVERFCSALTVVGRRFDGLADARTLHFQVATLLCNATATGYHLTTDNQ
jgi:hypothetical protein